MNLKKNNYRYDFPIIANWINPNSKVLDLGCGDGGLLNYLSQERSITGYGIEKNPDIILHIKKYGHKLKHFSFWSLYFFNLL